MVGKLNQTHEIITAIERQAKLPTHTHQVRNTSGIITPFSRLSTFLLEEFIW